MISIAYYARTCASFDSSLTQFSAGGLRNRISSVPRSIQVLCFPRLVRLGQLSERALTLELDPRFAKADGRSGGGQLFVQP